MNSYQIKYFLDAAKSNSISVSAQKNHITHSAVSQAIKNLEIELDIELLNHNKRKFELTDSGKASIDYLEKLYFDFVDVKSKIQKTRIEPSGELIVWAPHSLIVDSLIDCFVEFQKKYPKVKLQIQTGAAYLVKQSVFENKCQLGLAVNDHLMKNFGKLHITSGEFVLVTKNKNAKLNEENVLTTSLEKIEVVHLLKNKNIDIKTNTQIMSWGLIREFSLRGFGIGYVPEYVVKNELKEKTLYKVNYTGKPFKYEIVAIWNDKNKLDRNAELLLEIIKKKF